MDREARGCHRKGPLPSQKILTRFAEREQLGRITERQKCGACGHVGADTYLGELPELPSS